jgi:hypothetical protein
MVALWAASTPSDVIADCPVQAEALPLLPPVVHVKLLSSAVGSVMPPEEEALKVAVTLRAAVMLTAQLPVPEHAPVQPANVEPLLAAAVSVTTAPGLKLALQVLPHEIPAGLLLTVPLPVPALLTLSV